MLEVKNLIIGAGPAGIQMGFFFNQNKEDYIIIEKESVACSFFHKFPRQKKLISINKSTDLRYDWNSFLGSSRSLKEYTEDIYPSTEKYLEYVNDFIIENNLNIKFDYEIKKIDKIDDVFFINDAEIKAERIFFGIGMVSKTPPTTIVNDNVRVFTYENMNLDPDIYRGKDVHIIGTGNAALETARYIEPWTKTTYLWGNERLAWKTHYPGHNRTVNFSIFDSYFLKARTVFSFGDPEISYSEHPRLLDILNKLHAYKGDNIILIWCIGFKFDDKLVRNLVKVDNNLPILTHNFESTICKNLFFIGATTQYHDYKKGTSAFIHGFRYNCEYLYRYITHNITCEIYETCDDVTTAVFKQLNTSSALFHRFDYFCDLVGINKDGKFHYIKEIPINSVDKFIQDTWVTYFTLKLGYTNVFSDTFSQTIHYTPKNAHLCKFLHPIIQFNSTVFHVPEEPLNEFKDYNLHIFPFKLFLEYIIGILTIDEIKQLLNNIN